MTNMSRCPTELGVPWQTEWPLGLSASGHARVLPLLLLIGGSFFDSNDFNWLEDSTASVLNFLSPQDLIRDRGSTLMSRIPSRPISTKEAIVANYTKAQLVADVAESANVSKANVESVLKALFDIIIAKTKEGTKISIPQFGSFQTSERAARVGRNPQTGEEIKIPSSTVMKFTAAKALKDALND